MSTAFLTSRMLSSEIRARMPPFYAGFGTEYYTRFLPNFKSSAFAASPLRRDVGLRLRRFGAMSASGLRRDAGSVYAKGGGQPEQGVGTEVFRPPAGLLPDRFRQASAGLFQLVKRRFQQLPAMGEEDPQRSVDGGNLASAEGRIASPPQREEDRVDPRPGMEERRGGATHQTQFGQALDQDAQRTVSRGSRLGPESPVNILLDHEVRLVHRHFRGERADQEPLVVGIRQVGDEDETMGGIRPGERLELRGVRAEEAQIRPVPEQFLRELEQPRIHFERPDPRGPVAQARRQVARAGAEFDDLVALRDSQAARDGFQKGGIHQEAL